MVTVKCVTIKDINDKDLQYIVIENNGKKTAINVGDKTIKNVQEVLNAPEQKK